MQGALKPEAGPWINLSTALARVALCCCGMKVEKVLITTSGSRLENASTFLTSAVLMGIIDKADNSLNLINAEYFAKQLGVQVDIVILKSQYLKIWNTCCVGVFVLTSKRLFK